LKSILFCACALSACVATADETPEVRDLLERLDRSAATYRANALKFTCEETIKWSGRAGGYSRELIGGRERFGYVFSYEDDEGFSDYRTRLKRRLGSKPPRRVTPEEYSVPRYLGSAYLWIFTFKRSRWARHEYEVVGEETVLDRAATVLKFTPRPPVRGGVNDWYGKAWVDTETAQLLKVEAVTPEDHELLGELEKHVAGEATSPWSYEVEHITTWFEIEENGLRFPSRVEIRQVFYRVRPDGEAWVVKPEQVLQVDQTYESYEFFGVSAEVVEPEE
jgi:hypothetical protein